MNNVEAAYRAAGYVVMAMLWGVWRVDRVSLENMDDAGVGIEYAPLTEVQANEAWQQAGPRTFNAGLERQMAGPVAHALLLDQEPVPPEDAGTPGFDDVVRAIEEGKPGGSAREAWVAIREHEPVVRADLQRMWPVVEAVAAELIAKKELSDYELRSIVRMGVNRLPEADRGWAISRLRNTPPQS